MPQFVPDDLWHEHLLEQDRQDSDLLNQYKVIQRTGVGDNEPHWSSEPKTSKVTPVAIQIVERIRGIEVMGLQECIQRLSCPESEQTTQFRLRETPQPELLDRERLQHAARQVDCIPKAAREIIGNMNGYVHGRILGGGALLVKKAQQFWPTQLANAYNTQPRRGAPDQPSTACRDVYA